MGFIAGDRCVETLQEAQNIYFSGLSVGETAGDRTYRNFYSYENGVWKNYGIVIESNGAVTPRWVITPTAPNPATCDLTTSFFDGMALGWAVAAIVVIAWGFRLTRRQLGMGS